MNDRPGKYVRDHYGVPAYIGTRVAYVWPQRHGGPEPRYGKITGFDGQYLLIKFDDEKRGSRVRYHPTWEIEYPKADPPASIGWGSKTDSEFLHWLAERLVHVYGESPNVDFLHRLRAIADRGDQ